MSSVFYYTYAKNYGKVGLRSADYSRIGIAGHAHRGNFSFTVEGSLAIFIYVL